MKIPEPVKLRNGGTALDPRLGRLVHFDERSRNYPAVPRGSTLETHPLRSYSWRCETWNDQGQEGACVGFAWSHELAARPTIIPATAALARQIYLEAQKIDEWPGEDYSGTSVLAGAKTVQRLLSTEAVAVMPEYRWAFGIEDLLRVLGYRGPAVLGINWYSGMETPDEGGWIRRTGSLLGGHAILAHAVRVVWTEPKGPRTFSNLNRERSYVTLHNSWGRSWGFEGKGAISVADLDVLLREQGDACVPVIRKR